LLELAPYFFGFKRAGAFSNWGFVIKDLSAIGAAGAAGF
jgi:hypothetical protein